MFEEFEVGLDAERTALGLARAELVGDLDGFVALWNGSSDQALVVRALARLPLRLMSVMVRALNDRGAEIEWDYAAMLDVVSETLARMEARRLMEGDE